MPVSPGPIDRQVGARPAGRVSPDTIAEWQATKYGRLRRYAPPLPGAPSVDDLVPDDMLGNVDEAREAVVDELLRR